MLMEKIIDILHFSLLVDPTE